MEPSPPNASLASMAAPFTSVEGSPGSGPVPLDSPAGSMRPETIDFPVLSLRPLKQCSPNQDIMEPSQQMISAESVAANYTSPERSPEPGPISPGSPTVSPISQTPAPPEIPAACELDQGQALLLDVLSSDDERAFVEAVILSAIPSTSSNIISIGLAPTPQAAVLKDFLISQAFSFAEPVDLQVTAIHIDPEAVISNFTKIKGAFETQVQSEREQGLLQSLQKPEIDDASRTSTDTKVSSPSLDYSSALPSQSLSSGAWVAGMSSVKRKNGEYADGVLSVGRDHHEYDTGVFSVRREYVEDKEGMSSAGREYNEYKGGVPSAKRDGNEHKGGMPSVKRHYYDLMGGTSPVTTFDHGAQNDQSISQALSLTGAHFSGLSTSKAISQVISCSLAETVFEMLHASNADDPNQALREISKLQREEVHRMLMHGSINTVVMLLDPQGLQFPKLVKNLNRESNTHRSIRGWTVSMLIHLLDQLTALLWEEGVIYIIDRMGDQEMTPLIHSIWWEHATQLRGWSVTLVGQRFGGDGRERLNILRLWAPSVRQAWELPWREAQSLGDAVLA